MPESTKFSGLDEVYSGGVDEMFQELKVLKLRGFLVEYRRRSFHEVEALVYNPKVEMDHHVITIHVRASKEYSDHYVEVIRKVGSWFLSFAYDIAGIVGAETQNHETHDMYEALDMVFDWARNHM
jgi:hypothetical protein